MKKIYLLGLLSTLLFLVISCEKEIDLKAQTPPGQLYANCILNPDSIFRVYIGYSTPITAPPDVIQDRLYDAMSALVLIKDANDYIIDTLQLTGVLYHNTQSLIFESIIGQKPLPNTSYQLEISEPFVHHSKEIQAETTLPVSIQPIRARKAFPSREITGEDETFGIHLTWEDPNPQEENLFIIETICRNIDYSFFYPTQLIRSEFYAMGSENDNQEIGKNTDKFLYIFINDSKIPARQDPDSIHTKIAVVSSTLDQWPVGPNISNEILVNIHHVNREQYEYYKDVEKYRINTNGNDIFAQPIPVRGNMQGGLGFFGGETSQQAVLSYY
ncbi:DUF4249 domain-containing protein [Aureispira anguillae]|nr:DUF4249 domain-containing protein [Aureispira anguillae]